MSSGGPTTEARNALGALLKRLGIAKVVCVDDEHATAFSLEDILAWLESASPDDLASAFPDFEGRALGDIDIRKESFRRWWNGLPSAQKEESTNHARQLVQADARIESPDVDFMSILSEVFQGMVGVLFVPLGPEEWMNQRESLLEEQECGHTLFLFDQDMSKQGGRTNEGSTIVGWILARQTTVRPLCGILTHTANTENQDARWKELGNESHLDRDEFMLIPKSLLTENLTEFTRQVKAAVLGPSFRKMKELSWRILRDSLSKAKQDLDNLTVLDFDHMVMKVARGEGIWEGQILFRLHGHFHRMQAERLARQDNELASLISQMRKVSHIPEMGESCASIAVQAIQHAEFYEDAATVNSAHLDIATGDVFEVTPPQGGTRCRLMVATQACDLAIRPDGGRKVQHALLLGIVPISKKEANQPRYMELPYFYLGDARERIAVDFLSTSIASCWVLDTCVLNNDGQCGLRLDAIMPQGLLPGWGMRFALVQGEAAKLHEQCDISCVAEAMDRTNILKKLAPLVTSCGAVKASVVGNEINVPLRRVMRIRIEMAMEVVRRYAAYIARTPQEVDLARKA